MTAVSLVSHRVDQHTFPFPWLPSHSVTFKFTQTHGLSHFICSSSRTSRQHTRSVRQNAYLYLWIRQVLSQHGPLEKAGECNSQGLSTGPRDLVPHGEYGAGGVHRAQPHAPAHIERLSTHLTLRFPAQPRQPTLLLSLCTVRAPSTPHPILYASAASYRCTPAASRRCSRPRTR